MHHYALHRLSPHDRVIGSDNVGLVVVGKRDQAPRPGLRLRVLNALSTNEGGGDIFGVKPTNIRNKANDHPLTHNTQQINICCCQHLQHSVEKQPHGELHFFRRWSVRTHARKRDLIDMKMA